MKTYYDKDASIKYLQDEKIAIIGYGIQGRAQALNLRDSGCNVVIGNIKDPYNQQAEEDGFQVKTISGASKDATIILVLIPDQAHKQVYNISIKPSLEEGDLITFAHGYSIHYKEIKPTKTIDVCLLAPRMPGEPLRQYYLKGGGVPAFVDVYQDATGTAWQRLLALAKSIGVTRAGAMHVTFQEETEIDLFIEQFLLPIIIRGIRLSFDELTKNGFTPEAVLMELYASGEIGELLMMAAKNGLYRVWRKNASPTCQFGIFKNSNTVLQTTNTKNMIRKVLKELRDGSFVRALSEEAQKNYSNLNEYDKQNENSLIARTQDNLEKLIKYRP